MKNGQQSLRGGGESVEDDGPSGHPKDATADENVKGRAQMLAFCRILFFELINHFIESSITPLRMSSIVSLIR